MNTNQCSKYEKLRKTEVIQHSKSISPTRKTAAREWCNSKVQYKQNNELSIDDAVSIAKRVVTSKNIDVGKFDVEALKVKSKYEKGPIRLAFVARFFPKEKYKWLLDNEYWIVYFYSKGGLDKPDRLGGEEFYVLVDLHTGKVIGSFKLG